MQVIIFVGLQASGKSSFYKERFFDTHVRINLDMLRTRRRERLLLHTCIEMKQGFVIDNTNPTQAGRAPYIDAAQQAGFSVAGYYFDTSVRDCLARNNGREGSARISAVGIYGTAKKLQPPTYSEGFDIIYYVRITSDGGFVVEELPRPAMSPHGADTTPTDPSDC
jgi:hypothetical protein